MNNGLHPDKWIDTYGNYLLNYAYYRVNDRDLAEDLVQDVFVSAYKNKDGFNGKSSEKTWLVTILKNKIIDHYRKKSTQLSINMSRLGEKADYIFDRTTEGDDGNPGFSKHSVLFNEDVNLAENNELKKILRDCFERLPEEWNLMAKMKLIDDMNTEEIIEQFKISKNNFWVILHRAKKQLKLCLETNWLNQ